MRSRGTFFPRKTFSRNGITSSGRSGPPKDVMRIASYFMRLLIDLLSYSHVPSPLAKAREKLRAVRDREPPTVTTAGFDWNADCDFRAPACQRQRGRAYTASV